MARRKDETDIESGVIVQGIEQILRLAVTNKASDIHIEPEYDRVRVRFRVDGVLREIEQHPISLLDPMVSRIKVLANLDIAERRRAQDGRFQLKIEDQELDVRVSVFPTIHGQNAVLRVLDKSTILVGLERLGMAEDDFALYEQMITSPYGIIFVTGPSGSGKTTTLYSTLNKINTVEKSMVTLEDPIEYQLPMVRQSQIDPDAGLTFASGLRYLLRQDPDVILVGEIRDVDTAEIAVRAALTGHLVLTTLHTNDSIGAIARLTDMGIEPVLIASATIGVIAQRLVRTVCARCAEPYQAPTELLERLGLPNKKSVELVRAKGCEQCGYTGYRGRTGIFEIFLPDEELRQLITSKASADVLTKISLQRGMKTLREHGWQKALQKVTTVEEVLRVTSSAFTS
ncbi:MAG: type II/IV secretion system protein [Candidatus Kerfeldbacteria bacterium]|nr:type II/IV secretion system protein [Candidatus Kerfeldbacteria bacterium]